jgi:NAD(P)-dependent dehydrogenase (short-subunit alcohol dehydrogenase family)
MDLGLGGRIALVTGGSSGIGLETARLMLADGARVAVCGRDPARLAAAAAALAPADRVLAEAADVLEKDAMTRLVGAVGRRFGGLDILVCNAGQGRLSTFAATDDAAWHDEFRLKFFGVIHVVRAALPLLERSTAPAIVVVNSLLARQPEPHMVATSALRAGVQNLVKSLSVEFAPKRIRVNAILLGTVDSGQWQRRFEARADTSLSRDAWMAAEAAKRHIPLGRFGRAEEAAAAIAFLASPAASYVTGAALEVAGGVSRFA